MKTGSGIAIAGIWIAWALYCQPLYVTMNHVWVFFLFGGIGSWLCK